MNLKELLAELESRSFVKALIGKPVFKGHLKTNEKDGEELPQFSIYNQKFLEVVGKAARPRGVDICVHEEDGTQTAYYFHGEPYASIPAAVDLSLIKEEI